MRILFEYASRDPRWVKSAMPRLFIAADLPEPVRAALLGAQERLRRGAPPVTWVAPDAMHLTLLFIGETDGALAGRLAGALGQAVAGQPAFQLRLGAAGAFPNVRHPRVLWVGLAGATDALARLHAALRTATSAMGIATDPRPFHPHLTLGRVRREATPAEQARLGAQLGAIAVPSLAWRVEHVALVESELRATGPRYTVRTAAPLA
jgi:2'-5' RNA ligase